MKETTFELTFGGTYKNTPAVVAPIIQKVVNTYLPPWKYGSCRIEFVFRFKGWKMPDAEKTVHMLKEAGTLHSQFTVSFSENEEDVTMHLSLKQ